MNKISLAILVLSTGTWCSSHADMERSIPQRVFDHSIQECQVSCGSPGERLRKRCDICERDEFVMESFALPGGLIRTSGYGERQNNAWLGASLKMSENEGLSTSDHLDGVYITAVDHHTPASYGGLHAGDCIVAVDGTESESVEDIIAAVEKHFPGECMKITVRRNGQVQTLNVILGDTENVPPDTSLAEAAHNESG